MENNILYYPFINLPVNEWTIKSVLYWDTVGVIVPGEYLEKPEQLKPKMREMVQTGHIVQHFTSSYVNLFRDISKSVLKTFENKLINLKECQFNFAMGKFSAIHTEKFAYDLFEFLVENKVAKKIGPQPWSGYFVEDKIASIMMSYLAAAISKKINYLPSTDQLEYLKESDYLGLANNQPEKIRSKILNEIMPYPKDADFNKVIKFKEKYNDQLKRFRLEIEKTVWSINGVKDKKSKEKILKLNIEQLNDKKEELAAKLKENKFGKIAYGAFKGMVVDASITFVTGGVVPPFATALGTINQIIKEYKGNPIKNEELAFVALMEQRLVR
jgi:hypothetical protein